jgi:hypothetical protein
MGARLAPAGVDLAVKLNQAAQGVNRRMTGRYSHATEPFPQQKFENVHLWPNCNIRLCEMLLSSGGYLNGVF